MNESSKRASNQQSLLRMAKENVKQILDRNQIEKTPVAIINMDDGEEEDDGEVEIETERNLGTLGPRA